MDDVAVAEHGPEALQDTVFGKFVLIEALQALEVVDVGRVVLVPGVLPALAGAVLEAQRDDFLHYFKALIQSYCEKNPAAKVFVSKNS